MAKKQLVAWEVQQLIKSESKKQGISIEKLASKTDVNTTTIHRMIHGSDTGYKKVFKMLNILGVEVILKARKKGKAKK